MKARYFKKLRSQSQWYKVWRTHGLFGEFNNNSFEIVLARNSEEAINRLRKRHYEPKNGWDETYRKWAKYCVQPMLKPFERFKTYWA